MDDLFPIIKIKGPFPAPSLPLLAGSLGVIKSDVFDLVSGVKKMIRVPGRRSRSNRVVLRGERQFPVPALPGSGCGFVRRESSPLPRSAEGGRVWWRVVRGLLGNNVVDGFFFIKESFLVELPFHVQQQANKLRDKGFFQIGVDLSP